MLAPRRFLPRLADNVLKVINTGVRVPEPLEEPGEVFDHPPAVEAQLQESLLGPVRVSLGALQVDFDQAGQALLAQHRVGRQEGVDHRPLGRRSGGQEPLPGGLEPVEHVIPGGPVDRARRLCD
jgi:hypothetical protein